MSKKSILLIGKGFLGNSFFEKAIHENFKIIATNYSNDDQSTKLDIQKFDDVENLVSKINPDYILNLASVNNVDFLQKNPEIANSINTIGSRNIARIAHKNKIRFLHISTDSVFDGAQGNYSESDLPNPINVYAQSKFCGETEIQKHNQNHIIVRTNFYGIDYKNRYFFNWILKNFKEKNTIVGFDDIIFSPLDTGTLSKMLIELLDVKFKGILHLSSNKPISKFEFIHITAKFLGVSESNIICGKQEDSRLIAPRPKNTSLNNSLAIKLLKNSPIELSEWLYNNQTTISKYLK